MAKRDMGYRNKQLDPNDEAPLLAALRSRAREAPAATAIADPTRPDTLTYKELLNNTAKMGRALTDAGVLPGHCVVAVLPQSPELVQLFLAVASVATFAPVNPALTPLEIRDLFSQLQPALLLAETSATGALEEASRLGVPTITVGQSDDDLATLIRSQAILAPKMHRRSVRRDDPRAPRLILGTSGTTAVPKLVPLTSENLRAGAIATCAAYALTERDVRLNVMPLFHLQGLVGAALATLSSGGTLVCTPYFSPEETLRWISDYSVTWLSATPTMFRAVVEAASEDFAPPPSLRFLRVGSAPLSEELRRELERLFKTRVIEAYGMTEAFEVAASPMEPARARAGTIGPATGCEIAILDADGGGWGEIIIRGPTVFGEYLNDTSSFEVFTSDGWFKTGDIGRLDSYGHLAVSGRLKEFINRGGEKISPSEVEAALNMHPGVADSAVFPITHEVLGEDVAAAVKLHDGVTVVPPVLKTFLRTRIAAFKIPREIVIVKSFPMTPTGKIQRKELSAMVERSKQVEAGDARDISSQQRAIETALRALWAEVLDVAVVKSEDDFFALGGDSFTEAQIRARVADAFGVSLPPTAVYDDLTSVRAMARFIATAVHRSGTMGV